MRWGFTAVSLFFLAAATGAELTYRVKRPLGLIEPDIPIGRPLTAAVVDLGGRLFFETRLSASGKTSCASCHNPASGFADSKAASIRDDGSFTNRRTQSVLNAGYLPTTMWDGKYRSLEEQVFDTFRVGGDMGQPVEDAVAQIRSDADYQNAFRRAFGTKEVTAKRLTEAIAQYERSLTSGDSPFDHYVFGGDRTALTVDQVKGLDVFSLRGGCLNCHDVFHPQFNPLGGGTALFTDFRFHNLGVGYKFGRFRDVGRFSITRDPSDLGAFRTPSLRNVAQRAPYMHDGSLKTLEDVVEFYDKGGTPNPNLSPSIRPIFLTSEEKRFLVEFLRALSSPAVVEAARSAN
ncbi:cytochrome c peroxidase [Accumulibacter sp.]|uniref:cytochrome-c peroxidase n=1 Tax=Accumulibacter sp. TaxID=2053492 RepID=UPI0028C4CB11|nr:cytochrome c peroxidase [Accumulibacter sp.]